MQDSFDVTTIIFLALAVFVIWRLRSVLGQKTGREQPPRFDPFARREPPASPRAPAADKDNVVRLPSAAGAPVERLPGAAPEAAPTTTAHRWSGVAEPGSAVARGLDEIARIEPGFDASGFVEGARTAYEMIVTAFAQGDRATLKNLLSKDVYEGFEKAIAERERKGERAEATFVSIDGAEVTGVEVRNRVAQVTLRFLSKLITATRNARGEVVEGSADSIVDVTDIWTFARTLGTRDPNWQLVATEAGQ